MPIKRRDVPLPRLCLFGDTPGENELIRRTLLRSLWLATILSLIIGTSATADTLVADSDALENGNQTNVFLDSAIGGLTQEFNVALFIRCSRNDHIAGDTTIAKDATSSVPPGGSLTAESVTLTRPAAWPSDGTDCPASGLATDTKSSKVTVTAPAATEADVTYAFQLRWVASDTDVKQLNGANVAIHFTVRGTGGGGGGDPINTPPSVSSGNDVSGSEGSAIALDGTVSDDIGSPVTSWTYSAGAGVDPGAACSFGDASAVDTTITCTDDGQFTATLTASDGVNAPVSDTVTITVSNADPSPDAGADQTVNEGDLVSLSGSETDPGTNDTVASHSWSVSATNGQVVAGGSLGTYSFRPGDNGTYTVTYSVTDDDGGTGSDTATITVNNVAPTTSPVFAADATTPWKFNASFSYSDAGWLDTHAGSSITWTVNGQPYAAGSTVTPLGDTGSPLFETGVVSSSITLGPGCYTIAASGTALDDDGGGTPVSFTTGYETTPLDVPTVSFLAPIKDNERNFAKYGNVLPVKVSLASSCNPGTQIANASLYLSYISGSGSETITGDEFITTSVSSADTGNQMRFNDTFYIYNFSTKPLSVGKDWTLRVRYGASNGPILLAAVLQLKK